MPMVQLTEEERRIFANMLRSHAYRERLAAQRFGEGLEFVPDGEKAALEQIIGEEVAHYRGCLAVGQELGIDVESLVLARMGRDPPGIPRFYSWLDLLLAKAFNDEAGQFVLQGVIGSRIKPYSELAERIIRDEKKHGGDGAKALLESWPEAHYDRQTKTRMLAVHLDAAARCFGRPNSEDDRKAVALSLKTRDSAYLLAQFCEYGDGILRQLDHPNFVPLARRYLRD